MAGKSKVVLTGGKGDNDLVSETHQRINGNEGNDNIVGTNLADFIHGNDGDDIIEGGEGDDKIYGNDGIDTAVYSGSILDYLWEAGKGNSLVVTDLNDADGDTGTDTLKHIEYLQFDDYTYSTSGNNAALVVANDQTTDEDNALSFSLSAYDFEGDALNITSITTASGAAVSVTGSTALTPAVGSGSEFSITYDPGAFYQYLAVGETAVDQVTVEVSDGNGGVTLKTIDITVTGINDAPVANDDNASTTEDGNVVVDLLSNDTDVDTSDVLSVDSIDTTGLLGTVIDNGDGTVTYDTNGAFDYLHQGQTAVETFSYTVSDGNGGFDTATVSVTVEGESENLGFEFGNFDEWDTIGSTSISSGGNPEGNYFAVLNSNSGANQNDLETFLNVGPTDIDDITTGSPTNGSAIKTTLTLDAGDTIEFNWRFDTDDYVPFHDNSFYTSLNGDLFQLADVSDVGSYGDSGWQTASITVTTAGTYEFGFGVVNEGDTIVNSQLMIDDLTII